MAPDPVTMLSEKIDQVKEDLVRDVAAVNGKLDAIQKWMLDRPPNCPKPGVCIVLEERINVHEAQLASLRGQIAKQQEWQSRMAGALGLLFILLTLFGPVIRGWFNLP